MVEREQVLFPFLRTRLSATRMQWLGADFAQRKRLLLRPAGNTADLPKAVPAEEEISADASISLLAWRTRAETQTARR